jgi:hypothetical protein
VGRVGLEPPRSALDPAQASAEQPKQQEHDNDKADDAAEAARAVIAVGIVATTAAKQQNQHNDDEDEGQGDTCEARPAHSRSPSQRLSLGFVPRRWRPNSAWEKT